MSVLERRVRELGARWSGKRVRRVGLGVRLSRTGRMTVVVVCWSLPKAGSWALAHCNACNNSGIMYDDMYVMLYYLPTIYRYTTGTLAGSLQCVY